MIDGQTEQRRRIVMEEEVHELDCSNDLALRLVEEGKKAMGGAPLIGSGAKDMILFLILL